MRELRDSSKVSKRKFQLCVLYDGTGSNDEAKFVTQQRAAGQTYEKSLTQKDIRAEIRAEIQRRLTERIAGPACWGSAEDDTRQPNDVLLVKVLETKQVSAETGEVTEGEGYIDMSRQKIFTALTTGPDPVPRNDVVLPYTTQRARRFDVVQAWNRYRGLVRVLLGVRPPRKRNIVPVKPSGPQPSHNKPAGGEGNKCSTGCNTE